MGEASYAHGERLREMQFHLRDDDDAADADADADDDNDNLCLA